MSDEVNIDTADTIRHKPTGETWYVAYCCDGRVCCCGWPESLAKVEDCELIKKGTPDERLKLLKQMAEIRGDYYYDSRASYAKHYFHELATSTGGAGI